MGTRHLTMVQLGGEYKIAQYGQWDGYPSGQGRTVLDFLRKANLEKFAKRVAQTQWLTEEELKAGWVECGADPSSTWVNMAVSKKHSETYPERSRDTGAEILNLVYKSKEPMKLKNDISFASDSLFCEWAYVIDLDKKKLEVYKGFNESPLSRTEGDRFAAMPLEPKSSGTQYYPIRKKAEFDLENLPTLKDFLKLTEDEEEEEVS